MTTMYTKTLKLTTRAGNGIIIHLLLSTLKLTTRAGNVSKTLKLAANYFPFPSPFPFPHTSQGEFSILLQIVLHFHSLTCTS